jgi:hypothetical protein
MDQRIPQVLDPLLLKYTDTVVQQMPGRVTAFYLEGSIALGDFNPRLSDIDFVSVLNSPATSTDRETIQKIHRDLERKYPWKMSGMYFQPGDIGCLEKTKEPFLVFHDGKLKTSNRFELSSVTWWILKYHGIAVFGAPPESLNLEMDMEHLIQVQQENLNTYWASWTKRPSRMLSLASDWWLQWTVLGVVRQFHTIHKRRITSKVKAGEYACSYLPENWHPIIREAMALRENPKRRIYQSRIRRAIDAFQLIKYVIRSCNEFLGAARPHSPT